MENELQSMFEIIVETMKHEKNEDKIMELIGEYPQLLTCQDEKGRNLGMIASLNGMEKVAIMALRHPQVSLHQSRNGHNLGMYCACMKLEEATKEAMQNLVLMSQKDCFGWTLATYVMLAKLNQLYPSILQDDRVVGDVDYKGRHIFDLALEKNNVDFLGVYSNQFYTCTIEQILERNTLDVLDDGGCVYLQDECEV